MLLSKSLPKFESTESAWFYCHSHLRSGRGRPFLLSVQRADRITLVIQILVESGDGRLLLSTPLTALLFISTFLLIRYPFLHLWRHFTSCLLHTLFLFSKSIFLAISPICVCISVKSYFSLLSASLSTYAWGKKLIISRGYIFSSFLSISLSSSLRAHGPPPHPSLLFFAKQC